MKFLQSSLFRAVCAIVVGVLLIKFPADTLTWLTVTIGVIFLVSGLISCVAYFYAKRHVDDPIVFDRDGNQLTALQPVFPLVGVGSMVLGLILALMPNTFNHLLGFVIGAVLVLGAITQLMSLIGALRYARIGIVWWICPIVILLAGGISLIRPEWIGETVLTLLGWCTLLYGVTELINALKIHTVRRAWQKQHENAQIDSAEDVKIEIIEDE